MIVHRLLLEPVTDGAWRLCDGAVAHSDAANVVAYIEQDEHGSYDVVWVLSAKPSDRYDTIEEIFEEAMSSFTPSIGTKPVPIPHYAPLNHRDTPH